MGKLINAKKSEFQNIIESDNNIILVDFWASWCGPCKILGPVLNDVSNEVEDVTIIKINVDEDENSILSTQFGVRNIPTVIAFKNGEPIDKFVGTKKKEEIIAFIDKNREENKSDESKN